MARRLSIPLSGVAQAPDDFAPGDGIDKLHELVFPLVARLAWVSVFAIRVGE
jgi:hypothetical protein